MFGVLALFCLIFISMSSLLQMKLAGQSPSSSVSSVPSSGTQKDPVARKKDFLRRRRLQADSQGASKVIEVSHKYFLYGISHVICHGLLVSNNPAFTSFL